MTKMFLFGKAINEHTKEDGNCSGCRWDRPKACQCGGLIHIEYMDDFPYRRPMGVDIFMYYCDRCKEDNEA